MYTYRQKIASNSDLVIHGKGSLREVAQETSAKKLKRQHKKLPKKFTIVDTEKRVQHSWSSSDLETSESQKWARLVLSSMRRYRPSPGLE